MQPKTICTVRTVEILPNGDTEDDAVDGTARADRYIGCREKFIMLAMFNWHLSNNNYVKGGNNFLLRPVDGGRRMVVYDGGGGRWREGLASRGGGGTWNRRDGDDDGRWTTIYGGRCRSPAKLFLPLPPPSLVSDRQTELNKMYSIRLLIVSRVATHVRWLSPEHRPPASLEGGDVQTNWKKLFHSSVRR